MLPRASVTPEQLEFDGGKVCKRPLVLFVPNNEEHKARNVAFKIQTNAPNQYNVKPVQGILVPGESVVVQVLVKDVAHASPRNGAKTSQIDKFLIRFAWIEQTTSSQTKNQSEVLSQFWSSVPKDSVLKVIVPSVVPIAAIQSPALVPSSNAFTTKSPRLGDLHELVKPESFAYVLDLLVKNLSRKEDDRLSDNELDVLLDLRERASPVQWDMLQERAKEERNLRIVQKRQQEFESEVHSGKTVQERLKLVRLLLESAQHDIKTPNPTRLTNAALVLKRAKHALDGVSNCSNNEYFKLKGQVHFLLGSLYRIRKQRKLALENYLESSTFLDQASMIQSAVDVSSAICHIYREMGNNAEAAKWELHMQSKIQGNAQGVLATSDSNGQHDSVKSETNGQQVSVNSEANGHRASATSAMNGQRASVSNPTPKPGIFPISTVNEQGTASSNTVRDISSRNTTHVGNGSATNNLNAVSPAISDSSNHAISTAYTPTNMNEAENSNLTRKLSPVSTRTGGSSPVRSVKSSTNSSSTWNNSANLARPKSASTLPRNVRLQEPHDNLARLLKPTVASKSAKRSWIQARERRQEKETEEQLYAERLANVQPVSPSSTFLRATSASLRSRSESCQSQLVETKPQQANRTFSGMNQNVVVSASDVIHNAARRGRQSTSGTNNRRVRSLSTSSEASTAKRRNDANSKHYRRALQARRLRAEQTGKARDPLYPELLDAEFSPRERALLSENQSTKSQQNVNSRGTNSFSSSKTSHFFPDQREGTSWTGQLQIETGNWTGSIPRQRNDGRLNSSGVKNKERRRRSNSQPYSVPGKLSTHSRRRLHSQQDSRPIDTPCPIQLYSHLTNEVIFTALPCLRITEQLPVREIQRLLALAARVEPDWIHQVELVVGGQPLQDPNARGIDVGIKPHTYVELCVIPDETSSCTSEASEYRDRIDSRFSTILYKQEREQQLLKDTYSGFQQLGKDLSSLRKSCAILKDQVKLDLNVVGQLFAERVAQQNARRQQRNLRDECLLPTHSELNLTLPEDFMLEETTGPIRRLAVVAPAASMYEHVPERVSCHISVTDDRREVHVKRSGTENQIHRFDAVLESISPLESVEELHSCCLVDYVDAVLDGQSANIIVIGDTGCNKFDLLFGTRSFSEVNHGEQQKLVRRNGLIAHMTNEILFWLAKSGVSSPKEPGIKLNVPRSAATAYAVTLTAVELTAHGSISDLLVPPGEQVAHPPEIKYDKSGKSFISNLVAVQLHQVGEVDLVQDILCTRMDRRSSPSAKVRDSQAMSHCIVTVEVVKEFNASWNQPKQVVSKLTFVLAAEYSPLSALHQRSINQQPRIRQQKLEASHQPTSMKDLHGLLDVLASISQGKQHHPFRNTRLTSVLQSALRPDSLVSLVSVLNPNPVYDEGTVRTLTFSSHSIKSPTHVSPSMATSFRNLGWETQSQGIMMTTTNAGRSRLKSMPTKKGYSPSNRADERYEDDYAHKGRRRSSSVTVNPVMRPKSHQPARVGSPTAPWK